MAFLKKTRFGFPQTHLRHSGLAVGSMFGQQRLIAGLSEPDSAPKAKSVIFLFTVGGVSHLVSFDPKPAPAGESRRRSGPKNFAGALPAANRATPPISVSTNRRINES